MLRHLILRRSAREPRMSAERLPNTLGSINDWLQRFQLYNSESTDSCIWLVQVNLNRVRKHKTNWYGMRLNGEEAVIVTVA